MTTTSEVITNISVNNQMNKAELHLESGCELAYQMMYIVISELHIVHHTLTTLLSAIKDRAEVNEIDCKIGCGGSHIWVHSPDDVRVLMINDINE